jgi:predicted GIY-YIG superfamily endonuclease
MFTVYVLWSERLKKRYIGSTKNVDIRLSGHNSGKNRFTKGGIPWRVIHTESFISNSGCRKRELVLKSGVGRKYIDDMLLGSAP